MSAVLWLSVSWLCYPVSNKVSVFVDAFPVSGMDCLMYFNFFVDQKLWTLPQWNHYFTLLSFIRLLFS